MRFVFASNNSHKLEEVRNILSSCDILSLSDIGFSDEIEENGETLEANSQIKAEAVWTFLKANPSIMEQIDGVFSDDTGLEIEALGNQPGVHTARWAGEAHADNKNRAKALHELNGITNRNARFRTVITLIRHDVITRVDGIVKGHIATEELGEGGFGYDPIFIPEGYDYTFAQLPAFVKNNISHRARALAALKEIL